jgi:hypothetical protein
MQCQATKREGPKEKKMATSTKVNGEQILRERGDSGLHLWGQAQDENCLVSILPALPMSN